MNFFDYFVQQPDFNQFVIGLFLFFTLVMVLNYAVKGWKQLLHFLLVLVRGWPPAPIEVLNPDRRRRNE